MATTGKFNGTALLVYIDGVAIGDATTHTLNVSAAMIDATTKSSAGWKDVLPGLKEWSIDCDGFVAWDATEGVEDSFADLAARTRVTLKFSTEVTGDARFTGTAYITSCNVTAAVEDVVSYTMSFDGDGALTLETVT